MKNDWYMARERLKNPGWTGTAPPNDDYDKIEKDKQRKDDAKEGFDDTTEENWANNGGRNAP
jgi:hypothetical protein